MDAPLLLLLAPSFLSPAAGSSFTREQGRVGGVSLGEGQLQGKREGLIKTGTSEDQALSKNIIKLLSVISTLCALYMYIAIILSECHILDTVRSTPKTAFPSWTKVPRSVDLTRRQDQ